MGRFFFPLTPPGSISMLENSKILVTGGAGFIGSHIATKLSEITTNEVTIFDIFTTVHQENIAHLTDRSNVSILRVDVRDGKAVKDHMTGIDYIFHLAALVSVPQSIAEPVQTFEHNITGTINILQAAREHHVKKVILSSSAAAYGDEPTLPKLETMPTMPKTPYAVSKITGEQLCRIFNEIYNTPTVALRYFNVFGPRQDPNSEYAAVVPKFISKATNNEPPIIFGDGEQTRDMIFVDDVVNANIRAALSDSANGEIFNIATGKPITINVLANMIIELSENQLDLEYRPPRPGDILHSYANITKAKTLLDWSPKTELRDALVNTFKFFKSKN